MTTAAGVIDEASPASTSQEQDEQFRLPVDDDEAPLAAEPEEQERQPDSQSDGTEDAEGDANPDAEDPASATPHDDAIQSLIKPEQRKQAEPEQKPEASKAPEKKLDAKQATQPKPASDEKKDDPFEGLSRDDIKIKTRDRIVSLHKRASTAETKLAEREKNYAENEPFAKTGRNYTKLFEHYGISDDELGHVSTDEFAGAIRASASAVRAADAIGKGYMPHKDDLAVLDGVRDSLDQIYTAMGSPLGQVSEFTGRLPADLQDLVDSEAITEERARLLHAAEIASGVKVAAKKPETTARPELRQAPALREQPVQQRERQPSSTASADNDAWSEIVSDLSEAGIAPAAISEHFQKHLVPIITRLVQEKWPGVDPRSIPPMKRVGLARRAQAEFAERQPKPVVRPVAKQGQPLRATGSYAPVTAAEPDSALAFAVQHLSKPR
jgi:hypothetical protein